MSNENESGPRDGLYEKLVADVAEHQAKAAGDVEPGRDGSGGVEEPTERELLLAEFSSLERETGSLFEPPAEADLAGLDEAQISRMRADIKAARELATSPAAGPVFGVLGLARGRGKTRMARLR